VLLLVVLGVVLVVSITTITAEMAQTLLERVLLVPPEQLNYPEAVVVVMAETLLALPMVAMAEPVVFLLAAAEAVAILSQELMVVLVEMVEMALLLFLRGNYLRKL
jgi:hypothetical protein